MKASAKALYQPYAVLFMAALKTRLGLILAKAVAMRVMINATGCPAPVLDDIALRISLSSTDILGGCAQALRTCAR